jgi:hypothetical protein
MRVLQWMQKNQQLFIKPICEYCNGCKKTKNYLQNLYVGIAYLKWPYENYNRKDVVLHNIHSNLYKPRTN